MTITHYDLFAGIGGFSLALEEVFTDATIKHVFCEWELFPTAVLRQHWPDGEYFGDIAELVTHTAASGDAGTIANSDSRQGDTGASAQPISAERLERSPDNTGASDGFTIVTGGFPCQPFSHAGRRKGTADDRYQWPNMFAVIRNTKPEWVIAENVRGLVTWNDGLVLETVCADLESEGYEVQPFIIPAVAVGAPHRRDRVWIIGRNTQYAQHARLDGSEDRESVNKRDDSHPTGTDEPEQLTGSDSLRQSNADTYADTRPQRRGERSGENLRPPRQESERPNRQYPDWSRNWQEVAFASCDDAVDDGLPRLVDGVPQSYSKWRQNSLKAYGNGIVSQVAMEIMRGIKNSIA